jgi:Leucine-rich repeat (LRR) protein
MFVFNVSFNQMTGTVSANFGLLEISSLDFSGNHMHGTIPVEIFNVTHLHKLGLAHNAFSGPNNLDLLFNATHYLTFVDISYNEFWGSIPRNIDRAADTLQTLKVNRNLITGSIPVEITTLSALQVLNVSENSLLVGSLPANIGDMSALILLYVFETGVTGSIPHSVGQLTKLTDFFAYSNRLTGSLPQSVTQLNRVTTIALYSNRLSGSLPTGLITSLPSLQVLLLQDNRFSGPLTIAVDAQNITAIRQSALKNVDFSSNRFSGGLPLNIFKINTLQSFAAGSNCLKDGLSEDICQSVGLQVGLFCALILVNSP